LTPRRSIAAASVRRRLSNVALNQEENERDGQNNDSNDESGVE
jgi:hypothetical protein